MIDKTQFILFILKNFPGSMCIYVIVYKLHKKTKTKNTLLCLSIPSTLHSLCVARSGKPTGSY